MVHLSNWEGLAGTIHHVSDIRLTWGGRYNRWSETQPAWTVIAQ